MKTTNMQKLVAVALLAIAATTAQAGSWRINNDASKNPNFTDINAAMASSDVVAGDTLYLDPGCSLTTNQTITKQVTVVGCGYDRSNAPHAVARISGQLYIKAARTKIEGMALDNAIQIQADYVTLERCNMTGGTNTISASNASSAICATIRQCCLSFAGQVIYGRGSTSTITNSWTIENCYIRTNYSNGGCGCIRDLYNATIKNNFILSSYGSNAYGGWCLNNLTNVVAVNNIIFNTTRNYAITGCTGQITNNVLSQDYNASENKANISSLDEIMSGGGYTYTLVENSPAAGYGTDGTDCGLHGGDHPFVQGFLPAFHPYYTKAVISPRSDNDKVKVSLQIKTQDE